MQNNTSAQSASKGQAAFSSPQKDCRGNNKEPLTAPSGEVIDPNDIHRNIIVLHIGEWYDGKHIDEVAFCNVFLGYNPMLCYYGHFFSYEGFVEDETVKHEVFEYLRLSGSRGLSRKVKDLTETLKLAAYVKDMPVHDDRVYLANGTFFPDGTFKDDTDIVLNRLKVKYDPKAKAPTAWQKFINELLSPEDVKTFQEYLGYCLIPSTKGQKMMFIIGEGGEGKSCIGNIIQAIFGDNVNIGCLDALEKNRFARADLENKLLFIDDDMKMESLPSTNVIKSLVTSEGKSSIERKNEQSVQRDIYARLICFGNGNPGSLYDHSNGFYRRQIILRTKPKAKDRVDDPYLTDKFMRELEGIVLWALAGLTRLVKNNYMFTISDEAKANLMEVQTEGNNSVLFLKSEGYLCFDEGKSASSADLYRCYLTWCHDNAFHSVSSNTFCGYLKQHSACLGIRPSNNVLSKDGRKVRGFTGIGVSISTGFVPFDGPTPFDTKPDDLFVQ